MAPLLLGLVGAAIGSAFGGISILGIAISGATIGAAIGTVVGQIIESLMQPTIKNVGPKIQDVQIQESQEGASIPRMYGWKRIAGQMIWCTKFLEGTSTTTTGGKGTLLGGPPATKTITYIYSVSFAVALCEGPVTQVGRIWADGKLLDFNDLKHGVIRYRVYYGSETQAIDPLPEQIEGTGNNPAYRGISYIVFDNMPLEGFGNRIPQMQFEVIRSLGTTTPGALEYITKGFVFGPGLGEQLYATTPSKYTASNQTYSGSATTYNSNVNNTLYPADFPLTVAQAVSLLPNANVAILQVPWFCNDIRAGSMVLTPGIESGSSVDVGSAWQVGTYVRSSAHVMTSVSGTNSHSSFGGTPSDAGLIEGIAALAAKGVQVFIMPTIIVDVARGNTLANPYSASAAGVGQEPFPNSDRITTSPAIGFAGAVDKTATAATQINAFFTQYNAMMQYYVTLCGGNANVLGFIIGGKLNTLTKTRSANDVTSYPAVTQLVTLAAAMKTAAPTKKIVYAADWEEFHSHRPADGTGDVAFNMDPLWASANIDAVGIQPQFPLSDWRDGHSHKDYLPGRTIYDAAYLKSNIEGGEFYDWTYATLADRVAQKRTLITDTAYGKPWVFRQKDMYSWWNTLHYNRPAGVQSGSPTSWTAGMKPVWLINVICPSEDKGSNWPSAVKEFKAHADRGAYFSQGWTDNIIQRRYIEVMTNYWNSDTRGMIPVNRIFAGMLDGRPFPQYPKLANQWIDAFNWAKGYSLSGKIGQADFQLVIKDLLSKAGFTRYDVTEVNGMVSGYVLDQIMTVRSAIEPLGAVSFFDGLESGNSIVFRRRDRTPVASLTDDDMIIGASGSGGSQGPEGESPFSIKRRQETELPQEVQVTYEDVGADYHQAVAYARRETKRSTAVAQMQLPMSMSQTQAQAVAEASLLEGWIKREEFTFVMPPNTLAVEVGDVITATLKGKPWRVRLMSVTEAHVREAQGERVDPSAYLLHGGPTRPYFTTTTALAIVEQGSPPEDPGTTPVALDPLPSIPVGGPSKSLGKSVMVFMDLPLILGTEDPIAPKLAGFSDPWPTLNVLRGVSLATITPNVLVGTAAAIGVMNAVVPYNGIHGRWDMGATIDVTLFGPSPLISVADIDVLNGANIAFIETSVGEWEVIQYRDATLVSTNRYTLSKLLRGQVGTQRQSRDAGQINKRIVFANSAIVQAVVTSSDRNKPFVWSWGPASLLPTDPLYSNATVTTPGVGLRPYPPCQGKAKNIGGSTDITITWIRQTRIGGDLWESIEVDLGETFESYDLEIYNGATKVRTVTAILVPTFLYTTAMQTTDFGGVVTGSLKIIVYQNSVVFGRGNPYEDTLTIV